MNARVNHQGGGDGTTQLTPFLVAGELAPAHFRYIQALARLRRTDPREALAAMMRADEAGHLKPPSGPLLPWSTCWRTLQALVSVGADELGDVVRIDAPPLRLFAAGLVRADARGHLLVGVVCFPGEAVGTAPVSCFHVGPVGKATYAASGALCEGEPQPRNMAFPVVAAEAVDELPEVG